MNQAKAQEVLDLVKNEGIEFVDLRFSDPFGQWQHLTIPAYDESSKGSRGLRPSQK